MAKAEQPDPSVGLVRAMVRWSRATELPWEGTSTDLHRLVRAYNREPDAFPKTPRSMGQLLRVVAPLLIRMVGLEIGRPLSGDRQRYRVDRVG